MMKKDWITAALSNDVVVAELLIRMKQQQPPPSTTTIYTTLLPFFTWGHRKSRSKPQPSSSAAAAAAAAAASCFKKEQQSGSPTTPLCWSNGGGFGGASTSDCYDESSRPSDPSSGGYRSNKGGLGNEGATTSSYNKSRKRKSYAELKEEEDFLLKERLHLHKELDSMRVTMCNQIATSQNLKKCKIDLHQNPNKEAEKMSKPINHQVQTSCVMEHEIKAHETGFVLPDLNMTPSEEEV